MLSRHLPHSALTNCSSERIGRGGMTTPFPSATLAGLFANGRRSALAPGEALFRQGDPADRVFLIERGRVRMVRHRAASPRPSLR